MRGSFDYAHFVSVVDEREPWKPWANDPESYETAVLADLENTSERAVDGGTHA